MLTTCIPINFVNWEENIAPLKNESEAESLVDSEILTRRIRWWLWLLTDLGVLDEDDSVVWLDWFTKDQ